MRVVYAKQPLPVAKWKGRARSYGIFSVTSQCH